MPALSPAWSRRLASLSAARHAAGRHREIAQPRGLDFSSNDYLGLRGDPRLAEAAARAARTFGTGTGGARLLRGTSPLHDALETALADWKGTEACLLFNTGFQANATLLPALAAPGDALFSDALNHASLVDGCRMARLGGATVQIYPHGDLPALDEALSRWRQEAPPEALPLVVTDAVFSMDGDAADLPGLVALCTRHEALLVVDEAHATGLLGARGAGLTEAQGVKGQVPVVMGTLGKALGSFGAFVAGSWALREHLVNTCRGFIFSTALPASACAGALEAVAIATQETWRREKALAHAALLRRALGHPDLPSAIVPIPVGEDARAVALARDLQAEGYDIRAVRWPTVPQGSARLRVTTGAHQETADVQRLAERLVRLQDTASHGI